MLETAINLICVLLYLTASVGLLYIQQKYYSYNRFNSRRLCYIAIAGAAFVFGARVLVRTHPFFDPAIPYIPVTMAERAMAIGIAVLTFHGIALRAAIGNEIIQSIGIIPKAFHFWRSEPETRGHPQ